jgi:predicted naringenin-chalcone synthase
MAKKRIYRTDMLVRPAPGKDGAAAVVTNLVRASTRAEALRILLNSAVTARVASQDDIVFALGQSGGTVLGDDEAAA